MSVNHYTRNIVWRSTICLFFISGPLARGQGWMEIAHRSLFLFQPLAAAAMLLILLPCLLSHVHLALREGDSAGWGNDRKGVERKPRMTYWRAECFDIYSDLYSIYDPPISTGLDPWASFKKSKDNSRSCSLDPSPLVCK